VRPRPLFTDRRHAGRELAKRLRGYAGRPEVLVLALPRGGVPVAFEIAVALDAPLDVFIVRKLGTPGQPELAMGAIASGGILVLNEPVVRALGIPPHLIDHVTEIERRELERRERLYRGDRPAPETAGRHVILVDDGLATGSTMRAAAAAVATRHPKTIVIAAPVGARETCREMKAVADDVVCVETPEPFHGVGLWYEDFAQTTDDEVRALLAEAAERRLIPG
jgi:predicted phosphoribosyltransferase